jgi:predicted MFS family arabinose efflux permease
MPLSGSWSARTGTRTPARVFLPTMCAGLVLVALAGSFWPLLGAALVLGVGNGGMDVAMNAQGATVENRRGRLLLGKLHAGFSAGGLAGAGLGAVAVAAGLGVLAHFALAAVLLAVVVVPLSAALVGDDAHADDGTPTFARPSRALLGLGVLAFCCLLAEGAALDWSAVYVDDDLAASPSFAALAYAAFSAAMLTGRLLADRLAHAFGPLALLRTGGLLAGGGLGLAVLLGEPGVALAGFAAMGAGLSVAVPLVFRAATARGGAPSLAAVSTLGYTGLLAGPPLVGAVAEATSLPAALGLVAVLATAATVLAPAAA